MYQYNTIPTTARPIIKFDTDAAFRFGREDAADGAPFCPEAYFASDCMMASYCFGFLDTAPAHAIANAWLERFLADDAADQAAAADHAAFVRQLGA